MKPGEHDPDCEGETDARAEAMRWAVRHARGLSAAEEAAFHAWVRQGPDHETAFNRARATFARVGRVAAVARRMPASAARTRRGFHPAALAAAACIVLGLVFWTMRPPAANDTIRASWVATAESGPVVSPLPDGSLARLNVGAALQTEFTTAGRHVHLQHGEAFFSVHKDPARPFTVTVAGLEIRAVGTAFSVRLEETQVQVIVTEGMVAIGGADLPSPAGTTGTERPPLVGAGQRVRFALQSGRQAAAAVSTVSREEIATELSWNRPLIQFAGATLQEVVDRYTEIGGRQIRIADADLAEIKLGGQFPAGDLEKFVNVLTQVYDVRVEEGEDDSLVLHKRD